MTKVYIHSAVCISAQSTFNNDTFLEDVTLFSEKIVPAVHPNYKDFIAPAKLRRMAPGVKMGVTAANQALKMTQLNVPEAVITGTGMGCIDDTEKFLNALITNDEAFLTPTSFIQSTHNTVGAQIALGLNCKAYNNTYVHASASFETALLDAYLMLRAQESENVLVGGVDELGNEIINHVRMMEDQGPNGIQASMGEGAAFFVLASNPDEHAIEVATIEIHHAVSDKKINQVLHIFLEENNIAPENIDVIILGTNGDGFDSYYEETATLFSHATKLQYKHLSGEFYTASAFGMWAGYEILKRQIIPEALISEGKKITNIQTVLLYNQFKGRDHSFVILKR